MFLSSGHGSAGHLVALEEATHAIERLYGMKMVSLSSKLIPEVLGGGAQIGDQTFAVGNPLGLVGSLSAGVISGLDRSFRVAGGRT